MGMRDKHCASRAAGGLINPVTGRWMVKSWRIDDLLPLAEKTYRAIEKTLGISVYHTLPLRRYCLNADDIKRLGRRLRNPRYADVLGPFYGAGESASPMRDEHGSFLIRGAAYLDVPRLLDSLQKHFKCIDEPFVHEQLTSCKGGWNYRGIDAKKVFFCEGAAISQNPWLHHLPIHSIKGETLLLDGPKSLLPRGIYHHQKWILSYGDGRCRMGSTYDETDLSPEPTEKGAQVLMASLRHSIDASFQIVEHKAGLRPTTPDTRPIIGSIPGTENLYVLNGLSSKGASTAPHMCQALIRHVFHEEPLDPEMDCRRFITALADGQ